MNGPVGTFRPNVDKVHIYGAGISGLLLAYFLKKKGRKIVVHEKENKVGGKIQSVETHHGLIETAANALLISPDIKELLQELGLPWIKATPGLKRKIFRSPERGIVSLPFLTVGEFFRLIFHLWHSPPTQPPLEKQSLQDFFRPLLGPILCEEVLTPIMQGIYASEAGDLHLTSVIKIKRSPSSYFSFLKDIQSSRKGKLRMEKKEKVERPHSVSFPKGMSELTKALHEFLKDEIQLQSSPLLEENVNYCLCTNAQQALELLEQSPLFSPHALVLGNELKKIRYVPIRTSTYILRCPIPQVEDSFGLLFSPKSHFKNMGLLHNSLIFSDRVKDPSWRSYTFIARGENDHHGDITHDLELLGISSEKLEKGLIERKTTVYKEGLPIYDYQRFQALKNLREIMPQGLLLFGNYTNGLSLRDLVQNARHFAEIL